MATGRYKRPGIAPPATSPSSRPPYRRRPKRKPTEPQSLAALLPIVVARLGGADRANEQRVALVWDEAVGGLLAKHTRIEGVRGKTLLVRVTSSSYAHELVLLRREIVARLSVALGVTLVEEIRSRVGVIE
jgi:predicted nucleic acid-binding Zn ribbon protein